MTRVSFTTWSRYQIKLGPQKLGNKGAVSLGHLLTKEWFSKSLRKTFLGLKADKMAIEFSEECIYIYISKGGECIYNDKFFKVNASQIWQVRGLESERNLCRVRSSRGEL